MRLHRINGNYVIDMSIEDILSKVNRATGSSFWPCAAAMRILGDGLIAGNVSATLQAYACVDLSVSCRRHGLCTKHVTGLSLKLTDEIIAELQGRATERTDL